MHFILYPKILGKTGLKGNGLIWQGKFYGIPALSFGKVGPTCCFPRKEKPIEAKKIVAALRIRTIKWTQVLCIMAIRKMTWGNLRNWPDPTHFHIKNAKAYFFLLHWRELVKSGAPMELFPEFSYSGTKICFGGCWDQTKSFSKLFCTCVLPQWPKSNHTPFPSKIVVVAPCWHSSFQYTTRCQDEDSGSLPHCRFLIPA